MILMPCSLCKSRQITEADSVIDFVVNPANSVFSLHFDAACPVYAPCSDHLLTNSLTAFSKAFHGIVRAFQDEKAALIKQRVEEGVKRPKAQSLRFLWRFGIALRVQRPK